jgi:hypothetical protein
MKKEYLSLVLLAFISGCTTASKDIGAVYISSLQYASYDCDQLGAESSRILTRVKQLGVQLDKAAANDKAIGVAGAILFWPALFALGGNKQQEAEYSRLKGEFEAAQTVAIQKKCSFAVPQTSPNTSLTFVTTDRDFAKLDDVNAVPLLTPRSREAYQDWLTKPLPRAFVIGTDGSFNSTWGAYRPTSPDEPLDATARALSRCEKRMGMACKVYAIDHKVVWVP